MKIIADNKKARFNFFIQDVFEAGIVLLGSEVKSLREGRINISDAYIDESNDEVFLINAHISEYKGANRFNHYPKRKRKLLLHRKEINKIIGTVKIKGVTVVPLKMYFNEKNMIKVEIGIAKGKKLHDKRETEKQRDWNREKSRLLKD